VGVAHDLNLQLVSTKDFYQGPSAAPRTNNYLTFVFPGFAAHPGLYATGRSADS